MTAQSSLRFQFHAGRLRWGLIDQVIAWCRAHGLAVEVFGRKGWIDWDGWIVAEGDTATVERLSELLEVNFGV